MIVAEITTCAYGLSLEFAVDQRNGLPQPSVVKTDELITIGVAFLGKTAEGELDVEQLAALDGALRRALGL